MNKWHRALMIAAASWAFHSPASAQPCDPCCSTNLGGFYLGINGGIASYTWGGNELDTYFRTTGNHSFRANQIAYTAGLQAGYDWICCNHLFGLVADWNWTNASPKLKQDLISPFPDILPSQHVELRREAHWFSTFRARGGLYLCDVLLYLTGGLAVLDNNQSIAFAGSFQGSSFPISEHNSRNNHHWGWTVGLGTEYGLGCGWTLGAEFLYLRFDSKRFTFRSPTFDTDFNFDFHDDLWVARLALNYHFSLCSLW